MACYFDEHDCQPLRPGESPNHALHLARLLLDSGLGAEFDMSFNSLFANEKPPPPAAKKFIDELPTKLIREEKEELACAVCLKHFEQDEEVKTLPCKHDFHTGCIIPWLTKTNSCPVCRSELPTDDVDYENFKKQKKEAKEREANIEILHDSMFG